MVLMTMMASENSTSHSHIGRILWRGVCARCPHCGEGRLYRAYLKLTDACDVCGEPLGHIRADDGPAWLTILVAGHIVVGIILYVETHWMLALWASMTLFVALAAGTVLTLLPSAKGIFVGALWSLDRRASRTPTP